MSAHQAMVQIVIRHSKSRIGRPNVNRLSSPSLSLFRAFKKRQYERPVLCCMKLGCNVLGGGNIVYIVVSNEKSDPRAALDVFTTE